MPLTSFSRSWVVFPMTRKGEHLIGGCDPRALATSPHLPTLIPRAAPCPEQRLAFRLVSGAANVIGPKICLEDEMLMSSVKNNVGRGLNMALVNGEEGRGEHCCGALGRPEDVNELLKFIRMLHEGTLVFVASYDDPATKWVWETWRIFSELGSSVAKELGFRDSWVFMGVKGVQDKMVQLAHPGEGWKAAN
uniref:ILEI/PANDER domain-containing protein n=1 Tax=Gopherus evgoodei TaxID=1825980 RepID=A0A8C4VN54_9SAUR